MFISGQKLFLYPSFENLTTYFTIMEGFQHDFSEEDIKKALMETFNFGENVFASIEKGQTCGYVRFQEENTAIKLVAKMKEKLAKSEIFRIKGAAIDLRVLEGEEETEYLEHSLF